MGTKQPQLPPNTILPEATGPRPTSPPPPPKKPDATLRIDHRIVPTHTIEFPAVDLVERGWVFSYDDATRFVCADHPRGGGFSVCEVVTPSSQGDEFRVAVGKAIAAMMNCPVPKSGT